jgi:hypothetical protein
MNNLSFYCVNFQNEARKTKMIERFSAIFGEATNPLQFVAQVFTTDPRLTAIPNHEELKDHKRLWSIMLQHLDCMRAFLENEDETKEFLIICEDDIYILKELKARLPDVLAAYQALDLNIMLLGYLIDFKLEINPDVETNSAIPGSDIFYYKDFPLLRTDEHSIYCDFPYHLWGSQMYLIDRKHARFLLDKYTLNYAREDLGRPFNPDWTLTKDGKRAFVYPMLAVEEGVVVTDHYTQRTFHQRCVETHYDKDLYY